jgi:hypothetical protein
MGNCKKKINNYTDIAQVVGKKFTVFGSIIIYTIESSKNGKVKLTYTLDSNEYILILTSETVLHKVNKGDYVLIN